MKKEGDDSDRAKARERQKGKSSFPSGMLVAPIADKIFRGIPVDTIPVVTSESRLRLNYKAIHELGLEVPESLLVEAVEVIR